MIVVAQRAVARFEAWPFAVRAALACAWAALIWGLSSREIRGSGGSVLLAFAFNGGHFVLFGVLAGLVVLAWRVRGGRAGIVAWSVAVAYGVIDELHQSHVPGRDASVFDVATDACGAAFAVLLLCYLRTRRRRELVALAAVALLGVAAVSAATFY